MIPALVRAAGWLIGFTGLHDDPAHDAAMLDECCAAMRTAARDPLRDPYGDEIIAATKAKAGRK